MKILVAIPCYNCEIQIKRLLEKLDSISLTNISDVLFIDNHSTDNTSSIIGSALKKGQTLIRHKENYGLGGTFKTIITYAHQRDYDYIILLHGDDQASEKDLMRMLQLTKDQNYDCIFGARFMADSKLHRYSKIREYGNRFINWIFSIALRQKIYDIGSGLNSYRVNSLPMKEIHQYPNHLAFDVNLLLHFTDKNKKHRFLFAPIEWFEEDQKSNANNIDVGIKVLLMLTKHLIGKKNLSKNVTRREYEISEG
jgi:glycosyltransferase involved in cell wall biosynthesis